MTTDDMTDIRVPSEPMSRRRDPTAPPARTSRKQIHAARDAITDRCRAAKESSGMTIAEINAAAGHPAPWADRLIYRGKSRPGLESLLEFAAAIGVHVADLLAVRPYSRLVVGVKPTALTDVEGERARIGVRARQLLAERHLTGGDLERLAKHGHGWAGSITNAGTAGIGALIEFAAVVGCELADLFTDSPRYSEALAFHDGSRPWRVKSGSVVLDVWADDHDAAVQACRTSMFGLAVKPSARASRWAGDHVPFPGPVLVAPELSDLEMALLADAHRESIESAVSKPRPSLRQADISDAVARLVNLRLMPAGSTADAVKPDAPVRLTERHRDALDTLARLQAQRPGESVSMADVGAAMTPPVSRARVSILLKQARRSAE